MSSMSSCIKVLSRTLLAEIVEFCRFLEPTAAEALERQEAVQRVSAVITGIWKSASVEIFGSFVTGVGRVGWQRLLSQLLGAGMRRVRQLSQICTKTACGLADIMDWHSRCLGATVFSKARDACFGASTGGKAACCGVRLSERPACWLLQVCTCPQATLIWSS